MNFRSYRGVKIQLCLDAFFMTVLFILHRFSLALFFSPLFFGILCNFLVMKWNGGIMPVMISEVPSSSLHRPYKSGDFFPLLCDRFIIPLGVKKTGVFSIGDILMTLGFITMAIAYFLRVTR